MSVKTLLPSDTDNYESSFESSSIFFYINGKKYTLTPDIPADLRLVDYIRYHARLTGTKVLCREGGCGACMVVVTKTSPQDAQKTVSQNAQACQLMVYACHGLHITTVEGATDEDGKRVQQALAGFYGTQCGFCSPGMVMTMLGEVKRTAGTVTSAQAEAALDGNICRCTGYRPIVDAFKSLASDADPKLRQQLLDIEDSYKSRGCGDKCNKSCGSCVKKGKVEEFEDLSVHRNTHFSNITVNNVKWYQPTELPALYKFMREETKGKTYLVAGSTGSAVFKNDGPYSRYISLDKIPELQAVSTTPISLELGARVSLTLCIHQFRVAAQGSIPGYAHLENVADHWQYIANLGVRNLGSWGGNLMLKHQHPEFPSDVFVTLAACNATISVVDTVTEAMTSYEVTELLTLDMKNKVILAMQIPPQKPTVKVVTYKITPRAVNAHAYVNAAFRFDLNEANVIQGTPGLFFGGISPYFIQAAKTASHLTGKTLTEDIVREAANILLMEVIPNDDPHQGSREYRKSLVVNLFYKTVLFLQGDSLPSALKSGGQKLKRGLGKGQQEFKINKDLYPVGEPIPKIESNIQVSGAALYTDDAEFRHDELHGALVQTTIANAAIDSVDPSRALEMEGVEDYVSAKDIPGTNYFHGTAEKPDLVFAEGRSHYAGQAVGMVVARTRQIAIQAAKLVTITYSDKKELLVDLKDANLDSRFFSEKTEERAAGTHTVSGEMHLGSQFHMHMEPLSAVVAVTEDGYDVLTATQGANLAQGVVARVLAVQANSINLRVRRIGGGFGAKLTRGNLVLCAAAVAAAKLRRPVRLSLELEANMTAVGWREPYLVRHKATFTDSGLITALDLNFNVDTGYLQHDSSGFIAAQTAKNTYAADHWNITSVNVPTDTAPNTWCRCPGHLEGVAGTENVMEHIAHYLKKDPMEVRVANMAGTTEAPSPFTSKILPLLKAKSNYTARMQEVELFNENNRWRKRGLSVTPLKYPLHYPGSFRYNVQVVIYEHDGSVVICHGGIEMGQGINTKAVQVASSILGPDVPVANIKVKPTDVVVGANSQVTGGSFGSDLVCHGVRVCCERLRERINAVREKIEAPVPWPALVRLCIAGDVDLSERYWTKASEFPPGYDIWGGACVEVEMDALTGQYLMRRVDLIQDVGMSLSPFVDIGQVEGAFIMGVGNFTSEQVHIDKETGRKLVTGTWDYKPPTALDIPEDFRVTFLPDAPNAGGVLRSKATGEPPQCLSFGVVTALRHAIASQRKHAGLEDFFRLDAPVTVERCQQLCKTDISQFVL